MNGILLIDKPQGPTSHDVVSFLRKKLKVKKVGHAGTLDPEATGLLILLIGQATKESNRFLNSAKSYEVKCRLGITTDTDDAAGKVLKTGSVGGLKTAEIKNVINSFCGEIKQVVPRYSAIKLKGKKLYELARQGKVVELPERKVTIYSIRIKNISLPDIDFAVDCSKGTYIRSLCRDIGEKLGCGGCVWKLRRTASLPYTVREAIKLDQTRKMTKDEIAKRIITL